tara:strand:- start:178 stop:411 length:234 start_codon:yes stop_codon:yes gene_type:complete
MSSQQYKSPKEKKKANKKIEVDYQKLRKKRLAKDFQKVSRQQWNAADARRRLPPRQVNGNLDYGQLFILKPGTYIDD